MCYSLVLGQIIIILYLYIYTITKNCDMKTKNCDKLRNIKDGLGRIYHKTESEIERK